MFTGIVEELGEIVATEQLADAARLTIRGPLVTSDAGHGDSIAVNGVCLTVVDHKVEGDTFTVDVMAETLNRSSIGGLATGSRVNLERAAAVNSRLGGHIVQGHVDGTGTVLSRTLRELGGRANLVARQHRSLRGGEGFDHRRRHLAHRLRTGSGR